MVHGVVCFHYLSRGEGLHRWGRGRVMLCIKKGRVWGMPAGPACYLPGGSVSSPSGVTCTVSLHCARRALCTSALFFPVKCVKLTIDSLVLLPTKALLLASPGVRGEATAVEYDESE